MTIDLNNLTFGYQVAEDEKDNLNKYFVETPTWKKLKKGDIDVIFGVKGSGKSALYTLLLSETAYFEQEKIILETAENPTGKPIFSEMMGSNHLNNVNDFVFFWKIYFCLIVCNNFLKMGSCNNSKVLKKLQDLNLLEKESSVLKRLFQKAKNLVPIKSAELSLTSPAFANMPLTVNSKITFESPTEEKRKLGYISIDELVEELNEELSTQNIKFWILCDRLDTAFESLSITSSGQELDKVALAALFKTYLDFKSINNIKLKIFIRNDIWERIIENQVFSEASHIVKKVNIEWDSQSLMNLIISRALSNDELSVKLSLNKDKILSDYSEQENLYYTLFPRQVDIGKNQSDTFNWINNRIKDGKGIIAPREMIHFYNEIIANQLKSEQNGTSKPESPNIFSRDPIKQSVGEVSKTRIEQTIYAEYPELKPFIVKLTDTKAEQKIFNLRKTWGVSEEEAQKIVDHLVNIGFFEKVNTEGYYKIPFMYRSFLNISQGKVS